MQRRFLFLLNPRAGARKGQALSELIQQKAEAAGLQYAIEPTRADSNYAVLKEKIVAEQITDLIIAGGDGTVSAVTAALREMPIRFGIIPRGSGNGLALAAGITTDPHQAFDIILKGKAQPIDGFLINEQFSCMLSGIGFDAQVAHDFDRQTKRGFWKYAQLTMKNLTSIKTYPFLLKSKERNIQVDAYFISIANSNQFGNHFTIAPKASLQDGLLDIVVVEKKNLFTVLLKILWHIRFGTFTTELKKSKGITYFQTAAVEIQNPQKAPFHIDGDGKETASVFHIKVVPAAYRLLMP